MSWYGGMAYKDFEERLQKKYRPILEKRMINEYLEDLKPITGPELKRQLEAFRDTNKPNNSWSWFWRIKQNPKIKYSGKFTLKELLVNELWTKKETRFFYYSALIAVYVIPLYFSKKDFSKKYDSVNMYPYGKPPEYPRLGHFEKLAIDIGKAKRHQL